MEILLHQQDRLARGLQSLEGLDHVAHDGGREALGRLVDQEQTARLDDGAGDGQHLLLPAGEIARRQVPEALESGEEAEDPVEPHSGRPARCGRRAAMFSRTVRSAKMPMALRHIGDARARAMSGVEAEVMSRPSKTMLPAEACHRPMMVRSVVVLPAPLRPSSIGQLALRDGEVHAVQDVIRTDMRMHAGKLQEGLSHGRPRTPR